MAARPPGFPAAGDGSMQAGPMAGQQARFGAPAAAPGMRSYGSPGYSVSIVSLLQADRFLGHDFYNIERQYCAVSVTVRQCDGLALIELLW